MVLWSVEGPLRWGFGWVSGVLVVIPRSYYAGQFIVELLVIFWISLLQEIERFVRS